MLTALAGCTCCFANDQDVAGECGVRAMPTFQAFFNGEKVDELTGADPGRLQAMIAKYVGGLHRWYWHMANCRVQLSSKESSNCVGVLSVVWYWFAPQS